MGFLKQSHWARTHGRHAAREMEKRERLLASERCLCGAAKKVGVEWCDKCAHGRSTSIETKNLTEAP